MVDLEIPVFLDYKITHVKYKRGFNRLCDWYAGLSRSKILNIATPAWADKKSIKLIYHNAKSLSLTTGMKYEVDHIIPLKSSVVCGLHVHTNLRVVHYSNNRSLNKEFQVIKKQPNSLKFLL